MLSVQFLLFLLLVAGLVWLWFESQRASETAVRVCQRTCRDLDLQFLDQTVTLCGLGLGRNSRGRLQILRQFQFEFSTSGADRRQGRATMLGRRVEFVLLDHPAGSTLITPRDDGLHRLN